MLNKVMLIGNVGKNPEVRFAQNGNKIASFSLATSETWKDKETGEQNKKTEWHKIVVFNPFLANLIDERIKSGAKLFIEGSLQTRKWTDNAGADKYVTEVVLSAYKGDIKMLDSKPTESVENAPETQNIAPQDDLDDEIPF
tara:strand:- start:37 stop:459 length:423 start_codon:yes stop_codon:yes gene_type:complete